MTAEQSPPPDSPPPPPRRRLLDLDALAGEVAGEPLVARLRGREFTLPPSMPVGLTIFLNRAMAASSAGDAVAEDAATVAAVECLFGERAEEAMRAGFSIASLVRLATSYGVEASPPESPASAPSSSRNGRRSRRTSKPTTGSTSPAVASAPEPSVSGVSSSS